MPYEWSRHTRHDSPPETHLRLWPYRSLPKKGFAVMILATFTLITVPLYPLLGTVLVWGLLPFLMIALGGLWWGLQRSYRDAEVLEELVIGPEKLTLLHIDAKGTRSDWACNPYWCRVDMHATGGPVPHYLTMTGNTDREVEIGRFLSEDERKALFGEINDALAQAKNGR